MDRLIESLPRRIHEVSSSFSQRQAASTFSTPKDEPGREHEDGCSDAGTKRDAGDAQWIREWIQVLSFSTLWLDCVKCSLLI